ncbi:hypothetical protein AADZ91_07845 [Colwelliaceae bacterium 6441]
MTADKKHLVALAPGVSFIQLDDCLAAYSKLTGDTHILVSPVSDFLTSLASSGTEIEIAKNTYIMQYESAAQDDVKQELDKLITQCLETAIFTH